MNAIIYRGSTEIGGTLIELNSGKTRLIIDAGYPLFLKGNPIDELISKLPPDELLSLGVLPSIKGLYLWDKPDIDGIIISHAHLDHYGLLKYVHPNIPVYLSEGTKTLIKISQIFKLTDAYPINESLFQMQESFSIGEFIVKPYIIDHSAFDAAAFEICDGKKTIIYSGDFRGHGRKAVCLDNFIQYASKNADALFIEGTMVSRSDELTITENELELSIIDKIRNHTGITLFQSSSQNIDRIVSFYRAALYLGKVFVIDIYTANVLHSLNKLGYSIPCPSYTNVKVFFPYRITNKIFKELGPEYATNFSSYKITKEKVNEKQNDIVMLVRPSMKKDLELCNLQDGFFIYSLWQGYRNNTYQQSFETWLSEHGFKNVFLHTSGHAKVSDIQRMINELQPKKIVPIHTMSPGVFLSYSDKVELQNDGEVFEI